MAYPSRGFTDSLRVKITLLACAASLVTALVMGGFGYLRTTRTSLDTAIGELAGTRQQTAQQFRETLRSMRDNAVELAHSPAVSNIARVIIDPGAGPDLAGLRADLAANFTLVMQSNPTYTQLRLIGVSDGGRELVRINRVGDGFETVPPEAMQEKADEPYFQHGTRLPAGDVYFSPITYNRENGQLDSSLTPTVRAVVPVYGDDGSLFGMIVINADFRALLAGPFRTIDLNGDTFIINLADEYGDYAAEASTSSHEQAGEAAFLQSAGDQDFVDLPIDVDTARSSLGVVLSLPREELMRAVVETRRQSFALGIAVSVLISIATALIANQLTRPLRRMAREMATARSTHPPLHLPVAARDEIGELARAFQIMTEGLQQNEIKTRSIINSVVDGLIVIDESGNIDSYNPACERIFGYAAEEVLGRNLKMLMPPPFHEEHDQYLASYQRTKVRKIIGIGREVVGLRKDGSTFPMDLSVSEILLNDRPLYCGIVRDITERKQMDIMKDEFVSTVNHELRTPLTSIHGALGLLKIKSAGRLDEKGDQLLELAHNSCQRLTVLVNDILDLEKIAAGKIEYRLETVDICDLVRDIVTQNASLAESREISLETHFETDGAPVRLDQNRFNQALVNLLSNAVRYSPERDVITVSVVKGTDDQVRISVADNGPGIPESFRSKVFDRFAQADSSLTRQEGSSGLGLNITQTLIQAFGGEVSFETEEGFGTVFHFDLPIFRTAEEVA
jgi:PAS domain S-box-containing protein